MTLSILPTTWVSEKIGELCTLVQSIDPGRRGLGRFRYVDISSIDSLQKAITATQSVNNNEAPSRARQLIQTGDVLVSTVRPGLIAVALVPPDLNGAVCSTGFCVLRCRHELLDQEYLYFWVQHPEFVTRLVRLERGIGYPAVSDNDVRSIPIPLPPLPEQQRIVAILRQADAVRRLRRQANARAEALLPALFYEMFGDPVSNSMRWELRRIDQFGTVITGNTPPRNQVENYGEYIEWVKSDDLGAPTGAIRPSAERLSEAGSKIARTVPSGSTLITCIAGSHESIGKAGIADRKLAFNQQINAVIPHEDTNPHFFFVLTVLSKLLIQAQSTKGMKKIVNKSNLEGVKFIAPPKLLQDEFARRWRIYVEIMTQQFGLIWISGG